MVLDYVNTVLLVVLVISVFPILKRVKASHDQQVVDKQISKGTLARIKEVAICQSAIFIAARETGIGFYYPYIDIHFDKDLDDWDIFQMGDNQYDKGKVPNEVSAAYYHSESLLTPLKDESYDPEYDGGGYSDTYPDELDRRIKEIIASHRGEIFDLARKLIDDLFARYKLVARPEQLNQPYN